ncbi:hypothetical protein Tco_0815021, partial [Tanacetum coccineum]
LDEEETNEEEDVNELYKDVNVNLEGRDTEMIDASQTNISSISSGFISNMLNPNPDTGIDSILNLNTKSTSLVDVPVTTNVEMPPSSYEDRVKALEDDFSKFKQTNLFAEAVSSIPDRLRSEAQANNEDLIIKIDENMKKIIKEQVKVQFKEQVSKILSRIEKSVNEQLKAEVLIRSSNKSKTSYAVAANLSKLELKKILLDKMENNKSIDKSVQPNNLYKALVDAYESDKDILATYGDTIIFKRRQDDEDEDEGPSVGSNRGSKRRRVGKEPESTSIPKEKTSKSTGKSKEGFTEDQPVDDTTQLPDWFQKPAKPPTPDRDWNKTLPATHGPIQLWITFVLNQLKVDTLTLELLAGPTFELMKGSCKSLVELEYFLEEVCKATTDQLDWNNPEGQQYPHDLLNRESARDVYSKHRILAVTKLKIVEWHNYKHLDWTTVRKLTNLNVEERIPLGVSLRMFTRSIVLRRHVEDLQLGVKSFQKKLNLTRPDTYRSDLKRKSAYTTYSNSRGFIYQNKDKKHRLMCIDELHKFSDGTLNNVRSALDDILKRIRIEYLPQTVWRSIDREIVGAMIQAIDQQLRNRRLLRSLEKFVGGRPYVGNLQLLERTI